MHQAETARHRMLVAIDAAIRRIRAPVQHAERTRGARYSVAVIQL